ncbi:geranylgeranyl transferase type-2 subunit alpha isoform X2 [Toxotes jaculatrix]|uniref:geranylgeranyl transferase type-2 subunit alpha isoform X2 n=1 Tax=Toxotes jaculatrix TaxID=941984 RepID=UPI001B3AF99E|nr:geranylgeranyl transferase type-2 subunit alpha isoform X2 [Toxotes jaculatrix]XP_040896849.1 geranylgeranyl transferase type-2 subunit alpha isoform X2 [Toxotes jaculatrix]
MVKEIQRDSATMHQRFLKKSPSQTERMHGRLKIKSTAQQEEEKRKEREKKLKIYVTARDACFSKRKEGILDDEALQLTQQLLSANPDFATFWNYRREILMHLETVKDEDEMQKIYEAELSFLESCLKVNPKSYGSWHHRGWVSVRLPRPDWARELSLCDRCLSLDDRNFHCWDYRRMVVKMSGVPVDQELGFTDRLIGSNFSNYSSWHYRSTLLPLLHPESPEPPSPCRKPPQTSPPPSPQTHSHRVCEEQLLKEYELVQNAFFTDPNDQSAWFYYRWLLGRAEREEMISCVYASRDEERVAVAFSRPVNAQTVGLLLVLDGQPQRVEWRSVHPRFKHSPVWICDLPPGTISDITNEHNLTVHWTEKHTHRDCALYTGRTESYCRDSATDQELFRSELSVEKTSVLQSELQSCNQLQELEPRNKWCLLTIILLMRALDPLGYEKETLAHFQTLKEVDPMRSAYYSDLCSKFMIENTILKMEYAEVRVFSISDKNLTTLCHLDQLLLVTHINLSSNHLQRLPPQFAMLQCLEVLEADNNSIENLEGLYRLPRLEEVSLKNNKISALADLQPLASCPKLKRLDLRGNPVTQTANIESELAELLPSVTDLLL